MTPAAARMTPGRERLAEARGDALPDVHIHIGRIELTAVSAPPPPRRPPAPRKAMPLEEYLQRRSRKAR